MKSKAGISSILFILMIVSINSFAQEPIFTASLSSVNVGVGERFQVTYTLNANGRNFTPPSFKDLTILGGPSQSSSMQFINGTVSQSISYSYILQAKSEGIYKIGAASIILNGKTIQSNTISITVTKGKAKDQSEEGEENVDKFLEKNLFIKAIADRTTVYQGEGIVVTYKLFSKVSLVNINMAKIPELNGFWNQEIQTPQQVELKKEVIDGVEYQTADIKKMVLFPQHSGVLQLDQMEIESVVRIQEKKPQRALDPFERFFNDPFFSSRYRDVNYKIISKQVKINVLPLPSNAPDGFSGAVGHFTMNAFIDKPEIKTNEPVNLKIKISGKGNIKLIDPIKVEIPSDIENYPPKTADNIVVNANGVSGSRTFEMLLIPRHPGEFKISPIRFSYFDPAKNSYTTLESPSFILKVEKGSNDASVSASSGVSKSELQLLGKDIRYIKNAPVNFSIKGKSLFNSFLYYALLTTPVFLFIGFLVYRKKQQALNGNIVLLKSKRATKIARKRLTLAQKYLKENNKNNFHEEILKSIWGYTSDKLNIPVADLSKDKAVSALRMKNISEPLIEKYRTTIEHCEFARYAPIGSSATMESIYQDTMVLITQLEQELK